MPAPVTTLGPTLEKHPAFPNGTNVEFVRVDSPDHVTMRVWERGSGETLACGTGAAAVAVVARLLGDADEEMTVDTPRRRPSISSGAARSMRPLPCS